MNFFVVYGVTVASSVLKQEKKERVHITPSKIKSYIFDCFYLVTEKQMPKIRITQALSLKSNIFMYLKYKKKFMKMFRHKKLACPEKESTPILP